MVIRKCTDVFRGTFSCCGRVGSRGGNTWEDYSMKELIMREENFREEAQDFLALFKKKNNEKINKKKASSIANKEQH